MWDSGVLIPFGLVLVLIWFLIEIHRARVTAPKKYYCDSCKGRVVEPVVVDAGIYCGLECYLARPAILRKAESTRRPWYALKG